MLILLNQTRDIEIEEAYPSPPLLNKEYHSINSSWKWNTLHKLLRIFPKTIVDRLKKEHNLIVIQYWVMDK